MEIINFLLLKPVPMSYTQSRLATATAPPLMSNTNFVSVLTHCFDLAARRSATLRPILTANFNRRFTFITAVPKKIPQIDSRHVRERMAPVKS